MNTIIDLPHFKLFFYNSCLIIAENHSGREDEWYWQIFREWKEVVLPTEMSDGVKARLMQIIDTGR